MKITDGKKTVEIKIQRWNGACCKYDAESGEFVRDEDMCVFVTEL